MQNYTANVDTIKLAQKEDTGWGRRHRKLEPENQVNECIYLCAGGGGLLLIWELPSYNFCSALFMGHILVHCIKISHILPLRRMLTS